MKMEPRSTLADAASSGNGVVERNQVPDEVAERRLVYQ